MKKLALALIATAVISTPGFAKGLEGLTTVCNYRDTFHLSTDSIQNATITSLTGDEKVTVGYDVVTNGQTSGNATPSKTSFFVADTPQCLSNGGYAHVRYSIDANNYCDVAVHDAENMFHPDVTARCSGKMGFGGSTYDGFNTHSYSLVFTQGK